MKSSHVVDDIIARGICRFSCASRTCFCVDQQVFGGLSMQPQPTNSPHIDVVHHAHVTLAKIDANLYRREL